MPDNAITSESARSELKMNWTKSNELVLTNRGNHDQQTPPRPIPWPQLQTPRNKSPVLLQYTGGKPTSPEEEANEIQSIKDTYHPRFWTAATHYTPRYQGLTPRRILPYHVNTPSKGKEKTRERVIGMMDHGSGGQMNATKESRPGYDAFDSLEWDPDLPTSSTAIDDSPQPITIKPQPVAYTTVGSLVDPNAVPQFSAPNRIQREGANRRPLISIIRNQQFETVFQTRGPPPPLNMSNSMHYAQNLGRSPNRVDAREASISDRSSQSTSSQVQLNEQEKDVLIQQFGDNGPQLMSGNLFISSRQTSLVAKDHVFEVAEAESDPRGRLTNMQGPIQGLEKMQTLQRLSKFANPVQQLARSRLSEFAVANAQAMQKNSTNSNGSNEYDMIPNSHRTSNYPSEDSGELNLNFQFPPPGFGQTSITQANPLLRTASNNSIQPNCIPPRPPGYPQPLTAGPPGQRQYNASLGQHVPIQHPYDNLTRAKVASQDVEANNERLRMLLQAFKANTNATPPPQGAPHTQLEYPVDDFMPPQNEPTPPIATHSPETQPFEGIIKTHSGYCTTPIVDTLSPHDAEQYFPIAFPSSYTGKWNPLSEENRIKMAAIPGYMKKERSSEKTAELEKWFYGGQGRFWAMAEDDHDEEHKDRSAKKHDFGPIGAPKKVHAAVKKKPVTVDEVQKMTVAECAKPMIAALYGTMLEYSDRFTPGSRANLSQFVDSDPRHIDPTPEGNKSLFGEDWGAPAKPVSSRYHY